MTRSTKNCNLKTALLTLAVAFLCLLLSGTALAQRTKITIVNSSNEALSLQSLSGELIDRADPITGGVVGTRPYNGSTFARGIWIIKPNALLRTGESTVAEVEHPGPSAGRQFYMAGQQFYMQLVFSGFSRGESSRLKYILIQAGEGVNGFATSVVGTFGYVWLTDTPFATSIFGDFVHVALARDMQDPNHAIVTVTNR